MARTATAAQPKDIANYEMAGASLLALAKADPDITPAQPASTDWNILRGHLEARLAGLRNWRNSWWVHWKTLAKYILPRRSLWLTEGAGSQPTPNTMNRGNQINQTIVDPTGTQAMRICAAGMMSGLTSPSRPWFKLRAGIQGVEFDQEAQKWFDKTERDMYTIMSGSNFYDSLAQMYEDLVTFGTAPVIIYEDATDVIRCYNPCAGEYYLAVSSALRPETLDRQFVFTVSQIVEMFGLENCPGEIRSQWQTKGSSLDMERIVAHSIEPNFAIKSGTKEVGHLKGDFAYRETYWVWGAASDKPLSMRGFKEMPFIAPRWAVTANDPYGRSVGMDVLPDIMQLQLETARKAEAIEKQVRPPLLASVELKNEPSSILPGHITYVSNLAQGAGMKPVFEVKPDLQYMTMDLQAIQARIKAGFFNDIFLMIAETGKDMTAYEVAQRQQEKMQVLGPVIERFQNEGLSPAIKRIFAIMARRKLLDPPPKSLQGVPIQIEYVSMLALAQRAAASAGMERWAAQIGSIAAAKPDILDNLNEDEFSREYGQLLGIPAKLQNSPAVVAQIRAAKQQQIQAQQQAQIGMTAVQGAQTLSQTDVGGGQNALAAMLGRGNA